ncbi:YhjD/YihY/BrkB family envelope integrity protein [Buchananella felis]|uniref:YihY/virulence factor BrkB family protein n=1 Tax=Buchananella felis TaxID=3231492 RepID=UPI003527C478
MTIRNETPASAQAAGRKSRRPVPADKTLWGRFRAALRQPTWAERATALLEWYQSTHLGRALDRFNGGHATLLSGGITYTALFSLGAALTLGWTFFMASLGSDERLRASTIAAINQSLPGLLDEGGKKGLLSPSSLILDTGWNLTSVVAAALLLVAALGVMSALRTATWAMFQLDQPPSNMLVARLRDLLGYVSLGVGTLLTAVGSTLAVVFSEKILDFLHWHGPVAGLMIQLVTLLVAAAVDALLLWVLVRLVADIKVPRRPLLGGLAFGVVGLTALRLAGTTFLRTSSNNPLLVSFKALATMLLWINFAALVYLFACAWMSTGSSQRTNKEGETKPEV